MAPTIRVILMSPRYKGNLGFICRAMANFGLTDLFLIGPRADRESSEARTRAVHARGLLSSATVVSTLEDALSGVDFTVGTTARSNPGEQLERVAVEAGQMGRFLPGSGRVGLVLGPEETGLSRADLDRMDLLVTIPCTTTYPTMNLSHAAAILFYEITRTPLSRPFQGAGPVTVRLLGDKLQGLTGRVALKNPGPVRRAVKALVARSLVSEPEAKAILALVFQLEKTVGKTGCSP
ncbi:MAG: hypothetical protein HY815_02375 [Candidatus Riflebacteria bacterium]|nr:hypothetical protein [Candidatus Riflebacteria bacterium]